MTRLNQTAAKIMRGAAVALLAASFAGPALAAKGGNGNGNGNANGNGANAQAGNPDKGGNGRGAVASELKGLNAAHANINGLMNANPESRPGQIYGYQQTMLGAGAAGAEALLWAAEYERLTLLSPEEIAGAYGPYDPAAFDAAVAAAAADVAAYQALVDGGDTTQETADALLAAQQEAARLAGLTEEEKTYEFTPGYLAALLEADANFLLNSGLQEEQEALAEAQLLEMTGGEPLSDEALEEFLRLLGLIE